ncbi:hypothetical protein ABTZ03_14190 [Kitasatospora sp. NPDC096077]
MDIVISGLMTVGRGLLAVFDAANFVEGCKTIAQEARGTKEDEEK